MRFLPHTENQRNEMREAVGIHRTKELFVDVPNGAKLYIEKTGLSKTMPEFEVDRYFQQLAAKNKSDMPFFIGGGVYKHHVPATVDYIIQRGEFLTSYTPYQPEVSQGTLQVLFEFQTQVAMITGMDVANASLYDGSTAAVEALMMANRVTKRKKAIVLESVHPHYREVMNTYAGMVGFDVETVQQLPETIDKDISCVIVQYPNFFGSIEDYQTLADTCHANGALLIAVVTEIVALGALTPPGEWGADIVAAEGQSIGVPMGFGGPHIGLFACKQKYIRQIPGRLCGETVDRDGKRGYVLTLNTREQHIRRDKATSNICTNAGLCALAFSVHLSLLGNQGYTHLAHLNHAKAVQLSEMLGRIEGVKILNKNFFNEFTIELPKPAANVLNAMQQHGMLAGLDAGKWYQGRENQLIIAVTELVKDAEMEQFSTVLQSVL